MRLRHRPGELNLFGYRLHPMSAAQVIEQIATAVEDQRRLIMANVNVHGMAVMYNSPAMVRLHNQPDCHIMVDGMPVLFLANIFCGTCLPHTMRTTSLDFYDDMFALGARKGWKFAYVGGAESVLQDGLAILRTRFPGLQMEGRNGYFDMRDFRPGSDNMAIVDWLSTFSPDIVIVGMGMPRQEEWIESIQHRMDARVFLPTGAYLDYQVGVQRPAPRWLGRYGLEWTYRLLRSPRRLGHRYLVEPVVLAFRIATRKTRPVVRQPTDQPL